MQEKYLRLLKIMSDTAENYWSSEMLGTRTGSSPRSVIRHIKEMKLKEAEGGFIIHSWKGKGYQLEITDQERFKRLWADAEDQEVTEVLLCLLLKRTCKLDDLADMFHYSRSGMSRIMEKAGQSLEEHGLKLLSKPYVGLFVYGNEIHIRNYLYYLIEKSSLPEAVRYLNLDEEKTGQVREFLKEELGNRGVTMQEKDELFFLKYMGIQLARIRLGKMIKTDYFAKISNTEHLRQDMAVTQRVTDIFISEMKTVSGFEIENIYLALVYRQAFWQNGIVDCVDERNLQFYQDIVERSLERIKENYKIDLEHDEILVNGLILHIASNFRRYLLGMEMENLFYNSVLEVYPTAYYYAMEAAEEIFNYTKLSLSKYEISFLGMHFASFLERNLKDKKWKTAIICGSGFGTARLLESKLLNKYTSLEIIGAFSAEEIDGKALDADFYISTMPLAKAEVNGKPWVEISPLLSPQEQLELEKFFCQMKEDKSRLENGVTKYFLGIDTKMGKEKLLDHLCSWCMENGLISGEEAQGILAREELVSTEIVEGIAMPHGLIEGKSFLVFTLLKVPVQWGRTKVKIVILGCFARGDERMKEELEFIFRLLLNETARSRMTACKNEKELRTYVEACYGE